MDKYIYVEDMLGLYCRVENPTLPQAETYIHSSGKRFLIRKTGEKWIIATGKDGTDERLIKSKMEKTGIEWKTATNTYMLGMVFSKYKESDDMCEQTIEKYRAIVEEVTMMPKIISNFYPKLKYSVMNESIPVPEDLNMKFDNNSRPIHIGVVFLFSVLIILCGCVTCYIIVKYPGGRLSTWIENIVNRFSGW